MHQYLLRGSQLDRSILRLELEQLHQAWPWGGLARFCPTTPKHAERLADASVDPTEARNERQLVILASVGQWGLWLATSTALARLVSRVEEESVAL